MRKILSLGKYTMHGDVLGCGNFGRVELATHSLTNIKVAIKIIDTRKLNTSYASRNLYREARILGQIRHPNVVRLYETLKASCLYCLVLEYIPNKDLNSYLRTLPRCRMSEVGSWPMVRQLTSALVFLHQHNIVHRDLKMDNILLDESNENLKIIDFGLSNTICAGELLKTHCGSPEFAAPELFYDRHDYGAEVDAWSFGVIMYGMLVGSLPFVPGSTEPSKRHALLKMLNKGLTIRHKTEMSHLSVDCRTLLFQLIEPRPELRLAMYKVANHTWITREGREPIVVDTEPEIDRPLQCKVIEKLSGLHGVELEEMEKQVTEKRYDSLSAQYNMLMDRYSYLRRVRKITNLSKKVPRQIQSAVCRPLTERHRKPNSPPSRMKAIMESDVKDDTFVGTVHANMMEWMSFKGSKSNKPIITVSGVDVVGSATCHTVDGRCMEEQRLEEDEGGVRNQSMIDSDIVLGVSLVEGGGDDCVAFTEGMISSGSSCGKDSECTTTFTQPCHSKWPLTPDTSSENVDLSHSTSRTLLVRSVKLSHCDNSRQHAVNEAMREDSSEPASDTPKTELKVVNAEEPRSRKSRFKDWLKPKSGESASS